ncbi:flotillin family protein [Sinomicrobium sp. M5D2P9]
MENISSFSGVIGIIIVILFIFIMFFSLIKRYKRCPSDRILVVYGKTGKGQSARCIHGGAAFIWPVFQDYEFLDLTPMSIEVNLTNALSKQNIRVNVPSRFTIGVSTDPGVMQNAAERLLGLGLPEVQDLAQEIIFGQLRLVVASMDIEEINSDRDKFLQNITENLEAELKKVGLKLINVNITDIQDESGYISALGKEAAAHAINAAKKSVAEKDRDGAIGEANAKQEERTQVAAANAKAIEGENTALVNVANSNAMRREKEAEAEKIASAAEKVQSARALQEAYKAEQEAEEQRAVRDKATQYANVVVPAEIEKSKIEIDAEAEAEMIRRTAKGEADAILLKKQAEAQGLYEILTKQAQGLDQIVKAAGNDSKSAVLLLIADKLPELVKTQAEAIKNIKIDKVTVWDGNCGQGDGKTATANFLSGIYKSVPPLEDMFNMAGMQLPSYLKGEEKPETDKAEKETKDGEEV